MIGEVPVAPVQGPLATLNPQSGDGEAAPPGTDVGRPGRTALDDGGHRADHLDPEPDLVGKSCEDAAPAEALDAQQVEFGDLSRAACHA